MILYGTQIADNIAAKIKPLTAKRKYCLAIVQVGENTVSSAYVAKKLEKAEVLGIKIITEQLPDSFPEDKIKEAVHDIARQDEVGGVIVQLPLPGNINTQEILDCIPLKKDVDVLSSQAFGRFALGHKEAIFPPTVLAISRLLEESNITLEGSEIAVVGFGRLVGMPVTLWLLRNKATVYVGNTYTPDLASIIRKSEIVISGAGKPNIITGDMIKQGAVVIDAGTAIEGGETKGDVDKESVAKKARILVPVPGGVGPLTVMFLFSNLIKLSQPALRPL